MPKGKKVQIKSGDPILFKEKPARVSAVLKAVDGFGRGQIFNVLVNINRGEAWRWIAETSIKRVSNSFVYRGIPCEQSE